MRILGLSPPKTDEGEGNACFHILTSEASLEVKDMCSNPSPSASCIFPMLIAKKRFQSLLPSLS